MKIYNFNAETGEYVTEGEAKKHPLKRDKFIIPASATTVEPPEEKEGFYRKFDGEKWGYEEIPKPPVDVSENVRRSPIGLFGGSTLEGLFNVNH